MRANVRQGRLILTTCNAGFAPFLKNWLGALRVLDLQNFVVVALDGTIRRLLNELGLAGHALHFGRLDASQSTGMPSRVTTSWYDEGYRQLMGTHPRRVLAIFAHGGFDLLHGVRWGAGRLCAGGGAHVRQLPHRRASDRRHHVRRVQGQVRLRAVRRFVPRFLLGRPLDPERGGWTRQGRGLLGRNSDDESGSSYISSPPLLLRSSGSNISSAGKRLSFVPLSPCCCCL